MQSIAGSGGIPYEYTVAEAVTPRIRMLRGLYVTLGVLWCFVMVLIGFLSNALIPFVALGILPTPPLIFLLWKRTQREYEYSFFAGELTVSRILGKRWRKTLEKIPLRSLSAVFPCDEAHRRKAERYRPIRTEFAASAMNADMLFALLWEEDSKTVLLWAELNEKALKIIRFYNRVAVE